MLTVSAFCVLKESMAGVGTDCAVLSSRGRCWYRLCLQKLCPDYAWQVSVRTVPVVAVFYGRDVVTRIVGSGFLELEISGANRAVPMIIWQLGCYGDEDRKEQDCFLKTARLVERSSS